MNEGSLKPTLTLLLNKRPLRPDMILPDGTMMLTRRLEGSLFGINYLISRFIDLRTNQLTNRVLLTREARNKHMLKLWRESRKEAYRLRYGKLPVVNNKKMVIIELTRTQYSKLRKLGEPKEVVLGLVKNSLC